jgi:outer membrane translocation and assembly module TamA
VADNLELPVDQRTFNGGSRSVRSFQARDLGPVEEGSGSPLGGLYKSAYTIEYTHRLGGMFRLAAFTDAGNNLPDLGGIPFDEMRYALGVGVRVDLPVGPLRIDYGLNPNPTEDESRGALHISFGTFF